MIAEMIIWGFFSACGWMAANWVKEEIWPEKPAIEQKATDEQNKGTADTSRRAGESTGGGNHSGS